MATNCQERSGLHPDYSGRRGQLGGHAGSLTGQKDHSAARNARKGHLQGRGDAPRGRGACSGAASGLWGGAVPRGPITEKADGLLQSPSNPTGIPVSRVFLDMGSGRQPLQLKGVAFVICLSPDLLLPESQAWTSQPPPLSPVAHRPPPLCCMGPAPLNTPISTLPLGSAPQPSCAPALLRCLSATLPALPPQPS